MIPLELRWTFWLKLHRRSLVDFGYCLFVCHFDHKIAGNHFFAAFVPIHQEKPGCRIPFVKPRVIDVDAEQFKGAGQYHFVLFDGGLDDAF